MSGAEGMLQTLSLSRVRRERAAMQGTQIAVANSLAVLSAVLYAVVVIVALGSTRASACGTPH